MTKTLITLLLASNIAFAQSTFFGGIHGSYNVATLHNKEDAQGGDYLIKKNTPSSSYGITLGYRIKNKFEISIDPHYTKFHVDYKGILPDSFSYYDSFRGELKFEYVNIPLNYNFLTKGRFTFNAGLGFNVGLMNSYEENSYYVFYKAPVKNENLHRYASGLVQIWRIYTFGDTTYVKMDKPLYKKINFAFTMNCGASYAMSDKLKVKLFLQALKGVTDIENKKEIHVTFSENYFIDEETVNVYKEGLYRRFYGRPKSEYGKRPATYNFSIGAGISLIYYFKGGLLPSIH